ncbi:MAG: hypothetical protein QME85_06395 [Candidatus Saccharicenans sp.]|nr:hypothetical protein [Candidatus Saccharicenans sp.]MDI6849147.1 hypothetical protein [Candidatus Saccharicenans sp.]
MRKKYNTFAESKSIYFLGDRRHTALPSCNYPSRSGYDLEFGKYFVFLPDKYGVDFIYFVMVDVARPGRSRRASRRLSLPPMTATDVFTAECPIKGLDF